MEIGVNLLPYALESLAKFYEISKHLLSYLIHTGVFADVNYSPQ